MASESTTSRKKSPAKMVGLLLSALAIPILIVAALLLNMKNVNLGIVGLLVGFGAAMVVIGFLLRHLPETR